MSVKFQFDDKLLQFRMQRVIANRRDARTVALRVMVETVIKDVIQNSPVDTHRFKRAYQMAGNDLGVGPFMVDPVEKGRYDENLKRLRNQVHRYEYYKERAERNDRTMYKGVKKVGIDQGYVKVLQRLRRARIELAKFEEGGPGSIVIGGRRGRGTYSVLATVRTKVYGGAGQWIISGDTTIARIHNKEPHASLVQRNTRVVSNALWLVGRQGGRRVQQKYVKEVAKGTPWLKTA